MKKYIFAVAGGDLRFAHLANLLAADGNSVLSLALPESALSPPVTPADSPQVLSGADAVILPLPCTRDGETLNAPLSGSSVQLAECVAAMKDGAVLLGGLLPENILNLASQRGTEAVDYYAREELAVRGAVPTAEGAAAIAIDTLPVTLAGTRVLVTGYGRIGSALTRLLTAMHAQVTVAARNSADRARAEADGARAIELDKLRAFAPCFRLCYNTVPAPLFDRETLSALRKDCLLVDLAGGAGGVDTAAAQELGINCIRALSLPGRTAPETSGAAIKDAVMNILRERGGLRDGR